MPEPARSGPEIPPPLVAAPGTGAPPDVESPGQAAPLLEPAERRRDRVLPILVAGSLVVHAIIVLPSLLWRPADEAKAPREIPVEVVQEAPPSKPPPSKPPPPAAAKPGPPKPPPSKPAPPKSPPPKPEAPKPPPTPPKQDPPRPEPPKPEPPKPEPKKPAERAKPADPSRENVAQRMKDLLGAMPAIALPGEDPSGTDEVSYEQLVLSRLRKAKDEGRHSGVPGAASVTFVLDDAGGVASAAVVHPSGDATLDKEAVAMVYRGAPYPAPPPGARRDYTFTLRFMELP